MRMLQLLQGSSRGFLNSGYVHTGLAICSSLAIHRCRCYHIKLLIIRPFVATIMMAIRASSPLVHSVQPTGTRKDTVYDGPQTPPFIDLCLQNAKLWAPRPTGRRQAPLTWAMDAVGSSFPRGFHVQRSLYPASSCSRCVDSLVESSSRSVAALLYRPEGFLHQTNTNTMVQDHARRGVVEKHTCKHPLFFSFPFLIHSISWLDILDFVHFVFDGHLHCCKVGKMSRLHDCIQVHGL